MTFDAPGGRRRIAILGATGSIGVQALDVVRASLGGDEPLRIVAMSAGTNWQQLLADASEFDVPYLLLGHRGAARAARGAIDSAGEYRPDITVVESIEALLDVARPDLVLNAVVGFAGLAATRAALERGIDVALANKESLVAAGPLCMELAEQQDAVILPVDSEHSALLQCLSDSAPDEVESLVLTASGGPFRGRTRGDLAGVTVEQALAHPTWKMGGKITIDSATLMNKGLELIEAQVLFDVATDEVEVVVHPDSIVHSLVRHRDGSLLAHLGWPDMHVPIAYALSYPIRPEVEARRLDLTKMPALEFHEPDLETFRCLALAREAAQTGPGACCVLNAANEIAVEAFLAGRIPFLSIDEVVEATLEAVDAPDPEDFDEVEELDAEARRAAAERIG